MQLNVALLVLATALEPKVKGSFLHKDQSKDIPEVVHSKEPGNGYLPGSPLYDKQEAGELPGQKKVYTAENMPPVSVTMQCVINLAVQYFLIYTAVVIVRTYNDLNGVKHSSSPMLATLQAATGTVAYAPMLCVLFLGTRMRALQLSEGDPDKYDLPQPFVKTAMFCCAYAVLGQTLLVLALPVVLGQTPSVASDGTPEVKVEETSTVMRIIGTILGVLRWTCMGLLYGGFTVVCYGAVTMEAPPALWPDNTAPPVSPAVACTMNLSMQYFFVYLMIAIISTYEQFGTPTQMSRKLANVFNMSTNTVNFAPMLCILFIGARMRALQLDPKFGNPQPWAQNCFYLCTYSVLVQLLLVILVPLALGGTVVKGDSEGDVTFNLPNPTMFWILSGFRYVIMAALYGGFTAVIVSVCLIEKKDGPTPPVSPTMQCVMNLTCQYFFVYLLLWVFLTMKQLSLAGLKPFLTTAISTMDSAKSTVIFCPMLSMLFVGLRLRALQITSQQGAPQGYAQQAMFIATYSVLVQVLMVLLTPLFLGEPAKVDEDGNVISKPGNWIAAYTVTTIRYLALLGVYGGAVTVIVALFKITPETATGSGSLIPGVEVPTPPPLPGQAGSEPALQLPSFF